jgi:hypothetical protein
MLTPLKLFLRVLIASGIVLGLAHTTQSPLTAALLPLIKQSIASVQDDFTTQSLDLVQDGASEKVRLRANLTRPVEIGGRMFYPIGHGTSHTGGFQVLMTVGGVLSYSLLTLIVALAWPVNTWRTLLKRIAMTAPLMLLLVFINVTITFPAELWTPIHNEWVPDITWPLLQWSKILMGGGGLMLGLLFGGIAIVLSPDDLIRRTASATLRSTDAVETNQSHMTVGFSSVESERLQTHLEK